MDFLFRLRALCTHAFPPLHYCRWIWILWVWVIKWFRFSHYDQQTMKVIPSTSPKKRRGDEPGLPDGIHIFKPKIPIWANFGGRWNEKCYNILWLCGICYGHLVYFMAILVI
jgi:hypothetical protein